MKKDLRNNGKIDIAAIGYPAVREAFTATFHLCIAKLTNAEVRMAEEILYASLDDRSNPGLPDLVADTALYSAKKTPAGRKSKRAIDRVTAKLLRLHDRLKAEIAARLPAAIYSVFEIAAGPEPDMVLATDMLDPRIIRIMDPMLAEKVAENGKFLAAGRFVDLGPWHLGSGTALALSEGQALEVCQTFAEEGAALRDELHERIYLADLYAGTELEPMILALSAVRDAAGFGGLVPGGVGGRAALRAISRVGQ